MLGPRGGATSPPLSTMIQMERVDLTSVPFSLFALGDSMRLAQFPSSLLGQLVSCLFKHDGDDHVAPIRLVAEVNSPFPSSRLDSPTAIRLSSVFLCSLRLRNVLCYDDLDSLSLE